MLRRIDHATDRQQARRGLGESSCVRWPPASPNSVAARPVSRGRARWRRRRGDGAGLHVLDVVARLDRQDRHREVAHVSAAPRDSGQHHTRILRKDCQAFLFFKFPATATLASEAAREWIATIPAADLDGRRGSDVQSTVQAGEAALLQQESRWIRSTWLNVAFSSACLKRLVPPCDVKEFHPVLWDDPEARPAQQLGENPARQALRIRAIV